MKGTVVRDRVSSQLVLQRMLDSSHEEDNDSVADQTKHRGTTDQKIKMPSTEKKLSTEQQEVLAAARKYCFDNNLSPKNIKQVVKQLRSSQKDENLDSNCQTAMNRGAMLYERNMRIIQESRKRTQQRADLFRAKEQDQLTFQPEINPLSELIVEKLRRDRPEVLTAVKGKVQSSNRLTSLKKLKEAEEMAECSFHPTINDYSRKVSASRTTATTTSKFDELYEEAMKKRLSQELQISRPDVGSFRPQVNELSQMIVNGVPFEIRMKKYEEERKTRLQHLRTKKEEMEKAMNSRPKSRPKSGRLGSTEKNMKHQLNITRCCQKTEANGSPLKQSRFEVGGRSKEIHEQHKQRSFRHIFQLLDSDYDGRINSKNVDIAALEREVLRIVAPVLAEMEMAKRTLTEQEFMVAMGNLFSRLLPHERHELLSIVRSHQAPEQQPFRPSLNQKSMLLAEKIRTVSTPGLSLYDFCKNRQKEREKWLEQQREAVAARMMQNCSFVPNRQR